MKVAPETISFLDDYVLEKCLEITPDKKIDFIEDGLQVVPSFNDAIHLFYGKNYLMTIDYRNIR